MAAVLVLVLLVVAALAVFSIVGQSGREGERVEAGVQVASSNGSTAREGAESAGEGGAAAGGSSESAEGGAADAGKGAETTGESVATAEDDVTFDIKSLNGWWQHGSSWMTDYYLFEDGTIEVYSEDGSLMSTRSIDKANVRRYDSGLAGGSGTGGAGYYYADIHKYHADGMPDMLSDVSEGGGDFSAGSSLGRVDPPTWATADGCDDRQVLEGTVCKAIDLGYPASSQFYILDFGRAVAVSGMQSAGGHASLVSIDVNGLQLVDGVTDWSSYEGGHVTVAVDSADVQMPTGRSVESRIDAVGDAIDLLS